MNRDLYEQLVTERYGPLSDVEREAPPSPAELERRRRVLMGDDEEEAK